MSVLKCALSIFVNDLLYFQQKKGSTNVRKMKKQLPHKASLVTRVGTLTMRRPPEMTYTVKMPKKVVKKGMTYLENVLKISHVRVKTCV